jgi:hypothetical protein
VFWFLTGWLDQKLIFTVMTIALAIYPAIKITQKPPSKSKILSVVLFVITLPILGINILYFVSYYPAVLDKAEFGNFKYYISSGIDMDFHSHLTFYKCKKWGFYCIDLYRTYDRQDFEKIIIDKTENEVSAISNGRDSRLVYTDGKNPRLYEGYPEQLGNHIYQVSTDYESTNCGNRYCDQIIYTLYECNLDYKSCNSLPIQYTESYDGVPNLIANETTNEISAYDIYDETLIFTYGEHPRCYVEGCKILK